MKEAHEKGTPVMFKDIISREVYLPEKAERTCLHDGKTYTGGQIIGVDAPIEVIPAFIRNNRQSDLIGRI